MDTAEPTRHTERQNDTIKPMRMNRAVRGALTPQSSIYQPSSPRPLSLVALLGSRLSAIRHDTNSSNDLGKPDTTYF